MGHRHCLLCSSSHHRKPLLIVSILQVSRYFRKILTAGCTAAHLAGGQVAEVNTAGSVSCTTSFLAGTGAGAGGLTWLITSSLTLCKTEDFFRRHCSTLWLVASTLYGSEGRSNDEQGTEEDEMHLERRIITSDLSD